MNSSDIPKELKEMRKREAKVTRTLMGKALRTIDMLTCNDDFANCELLSLIYRIAHSASGVCLNPHESWREEIHKTYQAINRR